MLVRNLLFSIFILENDVFPLQLVTINEKNMENVQIEGFSPFLKSAYDS